ncbi:hypothetical protein [Glutamicibacter ardleyensis]|uniref:hypothetical protein n=1 Tax=Glutamicibacter ardleyensis TaxID=225894 RepID=UPI003FD3E522
MSDKNINDDQLETSEAETLGFTKPAKTDSRGRAWMLTLPADTYEKDEVLEKLSKYDAFVGQLEEGSKKKDGSEQGYRHWQIYLEHENAIRFSALRKSFPRGHFEMRKTTAAICVAYCTKNETRIGEILQHGHIDLSTSQGQRTDLEELRQAIIDGQRYEELILSDARALRNFSSLKEIQSQVDAEHWGSTTRADLEAHYLWGGTGVGKTSAIYAKHGLHYRTVHSIDDYRRTAHPWDSYGAQPVLLMDEFESNWSTQFMRKVLQPYPQQLPARYRNTFAAWETVWVVSNEPYSWQWKDEDASSHARQAVRRRFTSIGEMQGDGSVIYERLDGVELSEPRRLSFEEAFGCEMPEHLKARTAALPLSKSSEEDATRLF